MSEEIIVTVRFLAYKHANYIKKAIDTVLSQKVNFRYEIVIADDGSNDGTKEILMDYREKYPDIIIPIIHERNLGAANNSMSTLPYLRGKYITEGEADDFWTDDNRLQKQVDWLESHPDDIAVGCNYYSVDSGGENPRKMLMRWEVDRRYNLKDYLTKGYTIHGNTILRRNIFPPDEKYIKLRFTFPTMGDTIMRLLLYDKGSIYVLPDIMHAHRSGEANKTSYSEVVKSKMIELSYMYCDIVDSVSTYFNGKYDFSELKANRTGNIMLLAFVLRTIKIDKTEFKEYFQKLPPNVRRQSYQKCFNQLVGKIVRKIASQIGLFCK